MNNGRIKETEELVTDAALNESSLKKHKAGSVLVAMYGGFNQIGRTGLLAIDAAINQALVAIIPSKDALVSEYLLSNLNYRVDYWKSVASSSRKDPNITSNDIKAYSLPLPDLEEQAAIARALSDTDALLSELEKLITKKQAIKTATMQQLLTGRTRLPQFAHHSDGSKKGYKQSELGEIPEDWDVYIFGSLVNYRKGYPFKSADYQESGVRIIRVSDTSYFDIKDDAPIYIAEKESKKHSDWLLKSQDLIFTTVGSKPPMYDSLVGKAIMVSDKHSDSLLNQNAVRIRAKGATAGIQSLLLNHFRTERYINFIEVIYRGNANQASITLENLFEFQVPLPTFEQEQTAIATILSDMDAEIQALEHRLNKTRQIKQGMMQELLTGKTRLVVPQD